MIYCPFQWIIFEWLLKSKKKNENAFWMENKWKNDLWMTFEWFLNELFFDFISIVTPPKHVEWASSAPLNPPGSADHLPVQFEVILGKFFNQEISRFEDRWAESSSIANELSQAVIFHEITCQSHHKVRDVLEQPLGSFLNGWK